MAPYYLMKSAPLPPKASTSTVMFSEWSLDLLGVDFHSESSCYGCDSDRNFSVRIPCVNQEGRGFTMTSALKTSFGRMAAIGGLIDPIRV